MTAVSTYGTSLPSLPPATPTPFFYPLALSSFSFSLPESFSNLGIALALVATREQMSFAPEHLDNPDMSALDEQELTVLQDWADKLAKKYPVIGTIANSAP